MITMDTVLVVFASAELLFLQYKAFLNHLLISFILSWSLSVRSLVSVGGDSAKLPISIFQNCLPGPGPHLVLL